MNDKEIDRIMSSPEWERCDRLGILPTHPKFYKVADAVVSRLRQQPGFGTALDWCIALPRCKTVYPRSPYTTQLHCLFESDTGLTIDEGVFEIAAAEAGLPVDTPPGRERLRVGVQRVALRRIERRVAELPFSAVKQAFYAAAFNKVH